MYIQYSQSDLDNSEQETGQKSPEKLHVNKQAVKIWCQTCFMLAFSNYQFLNYLCFHGFRYSDLALQPTMPSIVKEITIETKLKTYLWTLQLYCIIFLSSKVVHILSCSNAKLLCGCFLELSHLPFLNCGKCMETKETEVIQKLLIGTQLLSNQ